MSWYTLERKCSAWGRRCLFSWIFSSRVFHLTYYYSLSIQGNRNGGHKFEKFRNVRKETLQFSCAKIRKGSSKSYKENCHVINQFHFWVQLLPRINENSISKGYLYMYVHSSYSHKGLKVGEIPVSIHMHRSGYTKHSMCIW